MARPALAALLVALVMGLSGCGSAGGDGDGNGNGNGVASVSTPTPDDSADPDAGGGQGDGNEPDESMSRDEMLLRAAQCLRDHGLDVEDPEPGEGLQIQVEGEDQEKADAAMKACEELMPPAEAEDPEQEREDMLAFAECMRDNGVEKFADPKPGEGINIGPEVAEDPDFEGAQKTCDEAMGGERERVESGQ